jgi:hypothetical protein
MLLPPFGQLVLRESATGMCAILLVDPLGHKQLFHKNSTTYRLRHLHRRRSCRIAGATSPRQADLFCVFADGVYQLAFALIRYAIRLIDVGDLAQAERLSSEGLELLQSKGTEISSPLAMATWAVWRYCGERLTSHAISYRGRSR